MAGSGHRDAGTIKLVSRADENSNLGRLDATGDYLRNPLTHGSALGRSVCIHREDGLGAVKDRDSAKSFLLKSVHIADDFRQKGVRGLANLIGMSDS
jgi:hypothetical protein